jgi:hydroxymethylglutaryl-CoA lyase
MHKQLPQQVKIVEVGPRDGLQNEKEAVAASVKIELVDRLSRAGFRNIEAASFVSPKWVPQMATSGEVMAGIERRPGTLYSALTPNMQGFEAALAAKADEVVIFGSASEAFSQRNINCSIAESIARFESVAQAAKAHGLRLRGSISCAFGCPYQGDVPLDAVADVVGRMRDLGCDEIDIADTIGVSTPRKTQAVMETAARAFALERISGHFHDTYGQALANIYASLEVGVAIFHSSVSGLGGCPYA